MNQRLSELEMYVYTVNVSNNYFIYKNESKKTCNPLAIQYVHACMVMTFCMHVLDAIPFLSA